MCTLIVASRLWQESPLLVAANRDEQLGRPSAPPQAWPGRSPALFAPVDQQAGGTWLGLNAAGLFAGVTNRFGASPPEPGRRSRGLLVLDALAERDPTSAAERVLRHHPTAHNRFHLMLADRERAVLVWSDGERFEHEDLAPGLHVLTERSLGAASGDRERLIHERLGSRPAAPDLMELGSLLSLHAEDPLDGTCVHAPELGYGTRSSTLIWLGRGSDEIRLWHAPGPPCEAPYGDLSGAIAAALGAA